MIVMIALSIAAANAKPRLVDTLKAVALPPVVSPPRSSRHSAMRAIMARAESLTDDGLWPSAQLIDESAVAFEAAVRLHRCSPVGTVLSFHRRGPERAGIFTAICRCSCGAMKLRRIRRVR